jgi:uncharacterized membrane protein
MAEALAAGQILSNPNTPILIEKAAPVVKSGIKWGAILIAIIVFVFLVIIIVIFIFLGKKKNSKANKSTKSTKSTKSSKSSGKNSGRLGIGNVGLQDGV